MDFFEHQETARRRSGILIFLFMAAIVAIIATTYISLCVLSPLSHAVTSQSDSRYDNLATTADTSAQQFHWWQPKLLLFSVAATLVIIASGSFYKIAELRGGGQVIATSLGGELISHDNSTDPALQQLLNIVDEMSLASGIPVPPVYVLAHESSINAFAAGYTPNSAVIGVSQGAVDTLSRDELQGVIAHEYSHILNGDMRTNIRIMGVLHGILLIAIIGFYMIRITAYSGTRQRGKNNPAIYLMLIGIAVVIIGSVGLFFGRLIKASLSRQREYLADASAVQFTRNPYGIGGALKKINETIHGSRIKNPQAEVASHMFFGNARRTSLISLLSTHPPLSDRIRRIAPSLIESHDAVKETSTDSTTKHAEALSGFSNISNSLNAYGHNKIAGDQPTIGTAGIVAGCDAKPIDEIPSRFVPEPDPHFPPTLLVAAHQSYSARIVVCSILLSADTEVRELQLSSIGQYLGKAAKQTATNYYNAMERFDNFNKLQLLDICHASLMSLTTSQIEDLKKTINALIRADQQIGLFEFMVERVIASRFIEHPDVTQPQGTRTYKSYRPYKKSISTLVAAISYASGLSEDVCDEQFHRTMHQFFPNGRQLRPLPRSSLTLHVVSDAMDHLTTSSRRIKQLVLDAAVFCCECDRETTIHELELIRALSASLGFPPPALSRPVSTIVTNSESAEGGSQASRSIEPGRGTT